MKKNLLILTISFGSILLNAQLYFPPTDSDEWDTTAFSSLGWCQKNIDNLYDFLDTNNTKAFILLKDGKIVLEQYFDNHEVSSNWYWASAGKSLTAFLVGMARQENYLSITDTTSKYLGEGWTSCTTGQEEKITIWHQLTMTTGLDDGVSDIYCTDDTCLKYLTHPVTRWAYHNAPYTLLDEVIKTATGQTLNVFATQEVLNPIGMNGLFIPADYNNVFYSTARSMARFGLLVLNEGNWDGTPIMSDTDYFNNMVSTSQDLNKSYGYLWWLNGKESFMIPQSQYVFSGSILSSAPDDLIAAIGKNGQFINVVPSENIVLVRMGEAPDNSLVPYTFNNDIWEYINALGCEATGLGEEEVENSCISVYPNPVKNFVYVESNNNSAFIEYKVYDNFGKLILAGSGNEKIDFSLQTSGVYLLQVSDGTHYKNFKLVKTK